MSWEIEVTSLSPRCGDGDLSGWNEHIHSAIPTVAIALKVALKSVPALLELFCGHGCTGLLPSVCVCVCVTLCSSWISNSPNFCIKLEYILGQIVLQSKAKRRFYTSILILHVNCIQGHNNQLFSSQINHSVCKIVENNKGCPSQFRDSVCP